MNTFSDPKLECFCFIIHAQLASLGFASQINKYVFFFFLNHPFRSIIKRATALEYKLHRLIVNKEDFVAYVQVEYRNLVNIYVTFLNIFKTLTSKCCLTTVWNQHFGADQEEKSGKSNIVLCTVSGELRRPAAWVSFTWLRSLNCLSFFCSTYITSSKSRRLSSPLSTE